MFKVMASSEMPRDFEPPDVYFTDAFTELGSHYEKDKSTRVTVLYQDDAGSVTLPCLIREIPRSDLRDITTPYGYGGPVVVGDPHINQFLHCFSEWAVAEDIVTAFIRFDPVSRNHTKFSEISTFVSNVVLVQVGSNIDVLGNLSPRYRKQYRRAQRAGLETSIHSDVSQGMLSEFREHYESSMRRVNAREQYYFSDSFWETVFSRQHELGVTISRTVMGSELHATGLRLAGARNAYNFLSATSNEGRHTHATEFDKINFCLQAQKDGKEIVNFGGGVGGAGDSLFEHKRRFAPSAELSEFYIGKLVFVPEAYANLAGRPFTAQGGFPSYRFMT